MIDEREFFQIATLKICSSLDADRFLHDSFMYIRNHIPADSVYLTHYYTKERKQLVFASASENNAAISGMKIDIPEKIHHYLVHPGDRITVADCAEDVPPALPWIEKGLMGRDSSLLSLRLLIENNILGAVTFVSHIRSKFNQNHARLLQLLKEPFAVAFSNSFRFRELMELKNKLSEESRFFQNELRKISCDEIIGAAGGLRSVMEMVRQVSGLTSSVLILGETGTGKEVIAATIHQLSKRSEAPFVKVNCGAIPDNLVDSELFGHEKGAFTGALTQKRGRFERANSGTIFLDEIGELRMDAQVRLLRVLQEKEIERVGGTEPVKVNVRIIAATHRDLEALVKEGRFREDLYFRLRVFPIALPPLRKRREDIPALVHHFVQKKSKEMGLGESVSPGPEEMEKLMHYSWPGNIRELENMVERALILSQGRHLVFNETVLGGPKVETPQTRIEANITNPKANIMQISLDDVVKMHIINTLKATKGKISGEDGAAAHLKINPSTLRKRMRKLGIPYGRKVSRWS